MPNRRRKPSPSSEHRTGFSIKAEHGQPALITVEKDLDRDFALRMMRAAVIGMETAGWTGLVFDARAVGSDPSASQQQQFACMLPMTGLQPNMPMALVFRDPSGQQPTASSSVAALGYLHRHFTELEPAIEWIRSVARDSK